MNTIEAKVFPSEENTITVSRDEIYGGAHYYQIKNCKGFNNGKTEYDDTFQSIQFIQKEDSGEITAGLQSEQLVLVLIDRAVKLNNRFPSAQNEKMINGLQIFLDACRERVEDRINRGVMGNLKN